MIALGCGHLAFGGQGFDLSDMGTRTPNGHRTDALARLSKKEEEAEVRSMPPPGKTVTLADVPSGLMQTCQNQTRLFLTIVLLEPSSW